MTAGRPPKYDDPEVMGAIIDLYFQTCDDKEEHYTVPGLAYALGFESRQSFWDYGQNPIFSYTIKQASLKIENQRVKKGLSGASAAVTIFDLKNNFGYKDKSERFIKSEITEIPATQEQVEEQMKKRGIPIPE